LLCAVDVQAQGGIKVAKALMQECFSVVYTWWNNTVVAVAAN
jgi:hypothetical protein